MWKVVPRRRTPQPKTSTHGSRHGVHLLWERATAPLDISQAPWLHRRSQGRSPWMAFARTVRRKDEWICACEKSNFLRNAICRQCGLPPTSSQCRAELMTSPSPSPPTGSGAHRPQAKCESVGERSCCCQTSSRNSRRS